jgi:hypothetical protein
MTDMIERFLSESEKRTFSEKELIFILRNTSLDIDGVIANSRVVAVEEFNRRHETSYTVEDIGKYGAIKRWSLDLGMTEEEAKHEDHDIWYSSDVLFRSPVMPGALEFLTKVNELGVKQHFFTTRMPYMKESTLQWFRIHFPFVNPDQIHVKPKESMPSQDFKPIMIRKYRTLLHVDDLPFQGKEILRRTSSGLILLSNDNSLDDIVSSNGYLGRYLRLSGEENTGNPNMIPVLRLFFPE